MIIDCISDLHGHYPKLEGGDLLIVAGDLTARDTQMEHMQFLSWIAQQNYKKKIWIAGNHDNYLQGTKFIPIKELGMEYLCDSGTEFEGLKIWGSPWTLKFPGMNPHCMAFTCDTEEELAEKWALIPSDTNILITHGPSWGLHDTNFDREGCGSKNFIASHRGSKSLTNFIVNHGNSLKLFVCGHIHESYGIYDIRDLKEELDEKYLTVRVNASHVNERYEPVNKPVRVVL